jgi:hypothetical protein
VFLNLITRSRYNIRMNKLANIPITKGGKLFNCSFCNRGYQRKLNYNRHVSICELMSKTTKERRLDSEDTPSLRVLYDIILELGVKMAHMEKKMNEMSNLAYKNKRNINMVEWLNENCKETQSFEYLIKNIKIERENLEYLFNNGYTSGIMNILKKFLPSSLEDESLSANNSIKAFDFKHNVLFVYCEDNTNNEHTQWTILPDKLFQQLINVVSKQLLNEFIDWQKENVNRMVQDDFAINYAENVKKILGDNMSLEQIYSRIKLDLFKHLKVTMKNITECQFI